MTRIICISVAVLLVCGASAQAAGPSLVARFTLVPPPGVVSTPSDVAADADGFVYVLTGAYVQRYAPDGRLEATWGGMGTAAGQFLPPRAPYRPIGPSALDIGVDGRAYVADAGGDRIVVFDREGAHAATWDSSANATFDGPGDVVAAADGSLLVLDSPFGFGGAALQRLDPSGARVALGDGSLLMTIASEGGSVFARAASEFVRRFDGATLEPRGQFELAPPHPVPPPRGPIPAPCCGIVGLGGALWVGRMPARELQSYSAEGQLLSRCPVLPGGVPAFNGSSDVLAGGRDGYLYVLRRRDRGGEVLRVRIDDPGSSGCSERADEPTPPALLPPRVRSLRLALDRITVQSVRVRQVKRLRVVYSSVAAGPPRLIVTRLEPGRRVGGRCRPVRRANAGRAHCVRRVPRGARTLGRTRSLSEYSYRLVDGLRPRSLRPGRYEIAMTVTDEAGARSAPARAGLRVRR